MDRIPVSAAVNTSVELAKKAGAFWTARFVNAVLRNIARQRSSVPWPNPKSHPVLNLAARKSFRPWMVARWIDRYGLSETKRLCDAINTIPPITLRVNTLKADRISLFQMLYEDVGQIHLTVNSPEGLTITAPRTSVENLPSFDLGWFQVQDEAAQLITYLLDPQPGQKVMDACAGLGGKTAHIAQRMRNQGHLLALDRDKNKLAFLKEELIRLGIEIVDVKTMDILRDPSFRKLPLFDKILVDAPCSGMGVLRRNPDTKWSSSPKKLHRNRSKQLQLLEKAASLVKPGGQVVYAVCSFETEENEMVIDAFLDKQPAFAIDNRVPDRLKSMMEIQNTFCSLKTLPHLHQMDGFFGIRLQRRAY
jgi:16S rRNA (cytosine967-C5)-methyltransferase